MWYAEGRAIRWRDVYLTSSNTKPFLQTLTVFAKTRNCPLDLIRSITFEKTKGGESSFSGSYLVSWLAKWLPKMKNLQHFSRRNFGYFYASAISPEHIIFGLNRRLSTVLASLKICANIQDLEIQGIENCRIDYGRKSHICVSIRRILPQLRSLKISRQFFCLEILKGLEHVCPKLEEVIIDIYFGYNVRVNCIRSDEGSLHDMNEAIVDSLVEIVSKAMSRGLMPQIKRFLICGGRSDRDEETKVTQGFGCQYKIDMLDQRTTIYPIAAYSPFKTARHGIPRAELEQFSGWILYQDPVTKVRYDLADVFHADFHFFVHGTQWITTSTGARLPPRIVRRATDIHCEPSPKIADLANNFAQLRLKHPWVNKMWFLQDQLKRRLIEVQSLDGMFYPGPVMREVLENEAELIGRMDPEAQLLLNEAES